MKIISDVFKGAVSSAATWVGGAIGGAVGGPTGAKIGAGIGSALGTKIAGGDTSDVLKAFAVGGIGGGISNKISGGKFFGMKPGSVNPFTQIQSPGGEIGAKIPGTTDTQTAVSSAAGERIVPTEVSLDPEIVASRADTFTPERF